MKILQKLDIVEHKEIANNIFSLKLRTKENVTIKPGQFAMLNVDHFLNRPISISDFDDQSITFVYKVYGSGTKALSQFKDQVEVLYPLGNGFNLDDIPKKVSIITGGIGIAPMINLSKELNLRNTEISYYLGFHSKEESYLIEELSKYGDTKVYSVDGSIGTKGFPIDHQDKVDYIISCGPSSLLNAITDKYDCKGQISTEEYMACGFGICSGCAIKIKEKNKKVCVDGPVFNMEELI